MISTYALLKLVGRQSLAMLRRVIVFEEIETSFEDF